LSRTLGSELLKIRKLKGLSLSAVAKPAGVSPTYLQKLERNQVESPSPHRLHKVAEVLGLDYTNVLRLAGYPVPAGEAQEIDSADPAEGVDLTHADPSLLRKVFQSPEQVSDEELEQLARYLAFIREQQTASV